MSYCKKLWNWLKVNVVGDGTSADFVSRAETIKGEVRRSLDENQPVNVTEEDKDRIVDKTLRMLWEFDANINTPPTSVKDFAGGLIEEVVVSVATEVLKRIATGDGEKHEQAENELIRFSLESTLKRKSPNGSGA